MSLGKANPKKGIEAKFKNFTWVITDKQHFYIRLVLFLITFVGFIYSLVLSVVDPIPVMAKMNYSFRIGHFFAYFTTQSNMIVCCYFFIYLFDKKFRMYRFHWIIRLAVTTYIMMTAIVFWIGLVTSTNLVHQYDAYSWVSTFILHCIVPILMLITYIFTTGKYYYDFKRHHYYVLWVISLYPWIYLFVVLLRGYVLKADGSPESTWFPYYFLNYYKMNIVEVSVGVMMVFVCMVFIQYFLIWINNYRYFKIHNINYKDFSVTVNKGFKYKNNVIVHKKLNLTLYCLIALSLAQVIFFILLMSKASLFASVLELYHLGKNILVIWVLGGLTSVFSITIIIFAIINLFKQYKFTNVTAFFTICTALISWYTVVAPVLFVVLALFLFNLYNPSWNQKTGLKAGLHPVSNQPNLFSYIQSKHYKEMLKKHKK